VCEIDEGGGVATVALGSTSITNFFCWRSLMVSFMATAQCSSQQPMSTGGKGERAQKCALTGRTRRAREEGRAGGERAESRGGRGGVAQVAETRRGSGCVSLLWLARWDGNSGGWTRSATVRGPPPWTLVWADKSSIWGYFSGVKSG
jgi:hypothetical protein